MDGTTVEAVASHHVAVATVTLAPRWQTSHMGILSVLIATDASGIRTSCARVSPVRAHRFPMRSADVKDKIEEAWLARWKSALGNPSKKPRRVMTAYIDYLDSTVNAVNEQMCWECWPEDDGGDMFWTRLD